MKPVFSRVNQGIYYTLEFYTKDRIAANILRMQGEPNYGYIESYWDHAYRMQKEMEDEIQQGIYTLNSNAQVELLEYIKSWQTDNRLSIINKRMIEGLVDQYNEDINSELEQLVEKKYEDFLKSNPFNRRHLEEYIEHSPSFGGLLGQAWKEAREVPKINYHYYCITEKPVFLKSDYIDNYIELLTPLIHNFIQIIKKYVTLYDAGKIVPLSSIITIREQRIEDVTQKQIETTKLNENKKLKTTLTAGQIIYLLQSLIEIGAVENMANIDICRFIAENISSKDYDNLSADSLSKKWKDVPINDIAFWSDKFPDLANKVIKDNPNRIKYKRK